MSGPLGWGCGLWGCGRGLRGCGLQYGYLRRGRTRHWAVWQAHASSSSGQGRARHFGDKDWRSKDRQGFALGRAAAECGNTCVVLWRAVPSCCLRREYRDRIRERIHLFAPPNPEELLARRSRVPRGPTIDDSWRRTANSGLDRGPSSPQNVRRRRVKCQLCASLP